MSEMMHAGCAFGCTYDVLGQPIYTTPASGKVGAHTAGEHERASWGFVAPSPHGNPDHWTMSGLRYATSPGPARLLASSNRARRSAKLRRLRAASPLSAIWNCPQVSQVTSFLPRNVGDPALDGFPQTGHGSGMAATPVHPSLGPCGVRMRHVAVVIAQRAARARPQPLPTR